MALLYGRENLMGLGFDFKEDSISYAMALKEGIIPGSDFETELPDIWTEVRGRTKELSRIYEKI